MKQHLKTMKNGDTLVTPDNRTTTIHHIGSPEWPQGGCLTQVGPRGQNVAIFKSKSTGEHFAKVDGRAIPKEICGLAAGRDAWMRDILFRCSDCRVRMPVGQMECNMCANCQSISDAEIAELDGK
jgi:hypothetical protein